MRTQINSFSLLVSAAIIVFALGAPPNVQAQMWGDSNGDPVMNPLSGNSFADSPFFTYYAETGVVTVTNVGANGVVDSPDNTQLLGDDHGLISNVLSVDEVPGMQVENLLPLFEDGVLWNTFAYFNGRVQLAGSTTPDGQFLPISAEETDLYRLPTGLSADDFRDENGDIFLTSGINFQDGSPGATLFALGDPIATGALRIVVPEPQTICLLGTAFIGLFGYIRRRQTV